jgi:DNA invertase Pin-like site-specific DNA recombinase
MLAKLHISGARCAIYTRKSSEEGLEQDFNSLHAQREACEAYIRSQKHEGWSVLAAKYDDGGYSGGTLQRPALETLLADIRTKKVNVVVVYKIDRLTRSLFDFAKIIEVFDEAGVSFVSVTQQFNTTTSMGRLTLNVLLSFAQFEREVTSERIRDKIAASKRKGMWMGGRAPLGYEVRYRKLQVVEAQAQVIRQLFELYLQSGNVSVVKEEFDRRKLGNKTGRGSTFSRGHIYKILSNPIYVGRISHKDQVFDGQHEGIVSTEIWEKVQRNLKSQAVKAGSHVAKEPSPLAGLLFDETGDRLTPSHAVKNGRRYRYYIARRLIHRDKNAGGMRLPAAEVEAAITDSVVNLLSDRQRLFELLTKDNVIPPAAEQLLKAAEKLKSHLQTLGPEQQLMRFKPALQKVVVGAQNMLLGLRLDRLIDLIAGEVNQTGIVRCDGEQSRLFELTAAVTIQRRGCETRLVLSNIQHPRIDMTLVGLVARGYRWRHEIVHGIRSSAAEIAKRENLTDSYVCRVMGLSFLAPDIVKAILAGRAPIAELRLLGGFPLDWRSQRRVLNLII